ncbi:hypothetical protein BJX99DRAFT_9551 [Aspergillus californicus]
MAIKAVLITGCSDDGIGSGLALALQQRDYHVFATARDVNKMSKLKDLPNVTLLALDVRDQSQITAAVDTVKATAGTLDYLVNNAARNHFMPILDEDLEITRKLYDTNVWGPVAVTQAFAPLLIKSHGTITFITSVSGYINVPYMGTLPLRETLVPNLTLLSRHLRRIKAFDRAHSRRTPSRTCALPRPRSVHCNRCCQTMGQTYFGDFKLPENSLYKHIEEIIVSRAQGGGWKSQRGFDDV